MSEHLNAAVHFKRLAELEQRPEERARLLTIAREFRFLAMAEAKRFIRDMPKRPAAPSARRNEKERKHG